VRSRRTRAGRQAAGPWREAAGVAALLALGALAALAGGGRTPLDVEAADARGGAASAPRTWGIAVRRHRALARRTAAVGLADPRAVSIARPARAA